MFQQQIKQINEQLKRTNRAIISLGCSFVQGQGAVDDNLYTDYAWKFNGLGTRLELQATDAEKNKLIQHHPGLINYDAAGSLTFTFMEYKNAFVNVLCNKYFEGSYTPINLGISGCGNRGSIKELYFYPEIEWHNAKEIIVLYCPSGLERFDFVDDAWEDHRHFKSMWPRPDDVEMPRKMLWQGYRDNLYTDKFEVLEQIGHVQELMNWCKNHNNARLVITPGFDSRYNKMYFKDSLNNKYTRTIDGELTETTTIKNANVDKLVNLFPWDAVFKPNGCETFIELTMKKEFNKAAGDHYFFNFLETGSPDKWITPCAHPAAKGHDFFAQQIFKHLKS
jgi:hypothetical protein